MRSVAAFFGFFILSGCASSTGVLPAGPDTYTLSEKVAPIGGGDQAAERTALTKGNEYCAQQARQFVPVVMGPVPPAPYIPPGYSVTFKCLAPGDPAIKSYQVQAAPNVVIEQRNR